MSKQNCTNCSTGTVTGTATECEDCLYGLKRVTVKKITYPTQQKDKRTRFDKYVAEELERKPQLKDKLEQAEKEITQQKDAGLEKTLIKIIFPNHSGEIPDWGDVQSHELNDILKLIKQVATQARQQAFTEVLEDVGDDYKCHPKCNGKCTHRIETQNDLRSEIRANIEKRRKE